MWGLILVVLIVVAMALATRSYWLPWLGVSASTQAQVNTIAAWSQQAAFLTGLAGPYLIAKARGDSLALDFLRSARIQSGTWDEEPPAPVVVTLPVAPEIVALQQQLAALTRVVTSQATSVPPAATAAPITNVTV